MSATSRAPAAAFSLTALLLAAVGPPVPGRGVARDRRSVPRRRGCGRGRVWPHSPLSRTGPNVAVPPAYLTIRTLWLAAARSAAPGARSSRGLRRPWWRCAHGAASGQRHQGARLVMTVCPPAPMSAQTLVTLRTRCSVCAPSPRCGQRSVTRCYRAHGANEERQAAGSKRASAIARSIRRRSATRSLSSDQVTRITTYRSSRR